MPWQEWLSVFLIVGTATAMRSAMLVDAKESLTGALDAITRKQRSLDTSSPEYYNDLRSFKYHGEPERKFDRDRLGDREIDEEEEEIEFLPNEPERDLNKKLLESALMDYYLKNIPQEEEPVTSLFRERERSSGRKRDINQDRRYMEQELSKLYLELLQNRAPYYSGDTEDEGYLNAPQMLYDQYSPSQSTRNKFYENRELSLDDLRNKENLLPGQGSREADENEYVDRDQDPSLYLPLAERRNVNARYPIGRDFKAYRNMVKRYPVAKRSPKPLSTKKQVTDPKVAQDLGALFGTESTENQNHSHPHDHEHDNHNHDHDHEHNHDHDHDHEPKKHESSSEAPKATPTAKGQKEDATKLGKSKSIEVRKKSVDWSQYFGIDRRRKKAAFTAGQGTQNRDDEWMLQRYYENMVENLKANDRDYEGENADGADKKEQMEPTLKNVKDMIMDKLMKYAASEDEMDWQKVRNKVLARMVAAYSLEKMRMALNDLRNNLAAQMQAQKAAQAESNQTSNFRENSNVERANYKRNSDNLIDVEGVDEDDSCPVLEDVKNQCRVNRWPHIEPIFHACVMNQICKGCASPHREHKCAGLAALAMRAICENREEDRQDCLRLTASLLNVRSLPFAPGLCRQCTRRMLREANGTVRYSDRSNKV